MGEKKHAYAPKPKIPPPPKREDLAKDSICHECSETGHWKRNCPQYLAELLKKKKTQLRELVVQGLRASRKLKSGALSLCVGNGQREAVEAIDVFYLCLQSGLEIVLNNCHYAPSITRGVISVSRLYGIFEIDLSNSYTNESSIHDVSNKRAKLDLESALLWHCCLGHISKKRIEKLQHDGLLNSTDLRAFEKCVSCISENMARKPYTHQIERAKDLLGLIHTDHKHEVFETFKVFQKEVENQLGYPKETMDYSFYYQPKNKVLVAQNAEFLKNSLITQEVSGSLEDLEIIQEEDTHPSIGTSLNHKEDDQAIDEPQSDINPICRSIRTRHVSDRMCLYIDAEEHELGDLSEPVNYKAALLDPKSEKWLNSMNVKIKWLFKKKTDIDGAVHTYKARLMEKGYTQTPRIDYQETFSPVADIRAIRILIARATYYDYEIWKMDVKTAFLNGYLNEETGYVFVLNGGVVDWKSAKQSIFATSSAEAEYIAAFDASKEVVWVRKFISGLGVVPTIEEPISKYCDNTGVIDIANESGITKGARHFRAKVHYLHEVIEYGDVKLEKVHTDDNLADPFTKALAFSKHSEHTRNIEMLPASSLM
uniref:CCHC-type domain-containing protein n=1 Tax=Tanacetum cinerariifolium TaxID=118510 RepID=A0A6L2LEG5_TANCI|nr:hypothetical protein [Tanacetum cinerariifolium]